MEINKVYEGDCINMLVDFPDNCIDTILTDPPYSLSSIKRRFAKTSIDDNNLTGLAAKNGSHQYGRLSAGFMGKEWDNEIAFNPAVWRECLRVAKPGAMLIACGGTRTYHRLACAIEDAGWETRDCIAYFHDGSQQERAFFDSLNDEQKAAYLELHYPSLLSGWVYGSGFPKSLDIGKQMDQRVGAEREVIGPLVAPAGNKGETVALGGSWREEPMITAPATEQAKLWDGYGTALKPAIEPIVIAMKPLDGTFCDNAEKWGVAGLNVDEARIQTDRRLKRVLDAKETINNTYAGRMDGSLAGGSKADGVTTLGRWPANVIHDNSDTVNAEFAKAGESVSRGNKVSDNRKTYFYRCGDEVCGGYSGERNPNNSHSDNGTPARYFAKCPADEPSSLLYHSKASPKERGENSHPTVKPLSLFRYLARLTKMPTGGIVLDPFAGSGTTGLAAIAEGRDYILIEKEAEYVNIIRQRIAQYTGQKIAPKEIELSKREAVKQLALW